MVAIHGIIYPYHQNLREYLDRACDEWVLAPHRRRIAYEWIDRHCSPEKFAAEHPGLARQLGIPVPDGHPELFAKEPQ